MLEHVAQDLLANLQTRHAEPQRHYHDWSHIEALLGHMRRLGDAIEDTDGVLYAILFHDAIYDPKAPDNERQSAELLLRLAPQIAAPSLALAHRMILATEGHRLPEGTDAEREDIAHFLDMDLAILGAGEARFDIYEGQIRREYAHVPDDAFRKGRAAVLRGFQARETLYFSEWGRDRFEGAARANIERSIARLEAPVRSG